MKKIFKKPRVSIDLGARKISCFIAEKKDGENLCILGSGSAVSRGILRGHLDDVKSLKQSLMSVVCEAETQARIRVRQASLILSGGFFKTEHVFLKAPITSSFVTEKDVQDMINRIQRPGLFSAHIIPVGFSVDQQKNIQNPCGMAGHFFSGNFHVLWVQENIVKTLCSCFKSCNIRLSNIIFGCYADSFFCLDEDERNLGATLINMGASCTTASLFMRGRLRDQVTVPMGGQDITEDIARSYKIKISCAEKIKVSHGAALMTLENYHKSVPLSSSKQDFQVDFSIPYTALVDIIQSRCEKILSQMQTEIKKAPHFCLTPNITLTGGGSHLMGIRELFQRSFGRPVHIVQPHFPQKTPHQSNSLTSVIGGLLYRDSLFNNPPKLKGTVSAQKENKLPPFFYWLRKLW